MTISNIILDKMNKILEIKQQKKQKFTWDNSIYGLLKNKLTIDEMGQLGEEILADVLKNYVPISYDASVTDILKGYDIIINNKKVEVKTATLTAGAGSFQHEHIENQRDYDYILFLDIAPNNIFITISHLANKSE